MIVSVGAAEFLPYLGFWNRIAHADKFVITDTSKYKHRDYMNRNRIRTEDGWYWFTVPVNRPRKSTGIDKVVCRDFHEIERTWSAVEGNYRGRAAYWEEYSPEIKKALRQKRLLDVNLTLIRLISGWLGFDTPILLASEVTDFVTEDSHLLSLTLARDLGATKYMTGIGHIGMLPDRFKDWGLDFMFQDFVNLPYPQVHPGWHPRMSVVDCLFTHGAEYTKRVAEGGWRLKEEEPENE